MNPVVSYFTTPSGDEMAIVPKEVADRMVAALEDLDDIAAFDTAIEADEESFPAEFVEALMGSKQPLKLWREYRGLTQANLASIVGLAQPALSALERPNARPPRLDLARKFAEALNCDIDDLFAE